MVATKNIQPSQTKNWDIVRHEPTSSHSRVLKELKEPGTYTYYLSDGQWFPIRKPTIAEILKDEYK